MNLNLMQRRIDAAMGRIPCDLVLKNARVLDVFNGAWFHSDLGILDGFIVGLDFGIQGIRTLDLKDKWIVPGFIDAHVHIESSLLIPAQFQKVVLPRGTTTAVCDPHELANVEGVRGIEYFLSESLKSILDIQVMLSSCVPATHMETNGGGVLSLHHLEPLRNHPKALGLAEMMNVPGVIQADTEVINKLIAFSSRVVDGHCPLLKGRDLSAYASTGISSCHESSELEEAKEKLKKGLAIWIREGSVAKDLEALIPILTPSSSAFVGFCTDDRNPLDISKEGHIDFLVRKAIQKGVAPPIAYRSASWTVARHYGLDKGWNRKGALAPGYQADLVILEDASSCSVAEVIKNGQLISETNLNCSHSSQYINSVRATTPEPSDLEGPQGQIHCIDIYPGKIITGRSVRGSSDPGVAKLSVLERYGHFSPPANAYVFGFGDKLDGAIASSVGHDSHNLCVVGSNVKDMQVALKSLIEVGGGFSVVSGKTVLAELALPFGGLMTHLDASLVEKQLIELRAASKAIGCVLDEPFLQLAFLCLPVIPSLKLTDKGLVDVEQFKIIDVAL
jgi:adenine deaminase